MEDGQANQEAAKAYVAALEAGLCTVDELLAIGGEDTEVVLIHHIRSSTLTVGGKAV